MKRPGEQLKAKAKTNAAQQRHYIANLVVRNACWHPSHIGCDGGRRDNAFHPFVRTQMQRCVDLLVRRRSWRRCRSPASGTRRPTSGRCCCPWRRGGLGSLEMFASGGREAEVSSQPVSCASRRTFLRRSVKSPRWGGRQAGAENDFS